jgi:thiol-disulfide isomerase/thioredoxin
MLLEAPPLRLSSDTLIGLLPLLAPLALLAACDRQSPSAPQGNAATPPISGEATGPAESGKSAPAYRIDRSHAGTPVPDLSFHAPDGGDATLKDVEGKPMLVNLWATWCAPCVAEMPALDRIATEYAAKGLVVYTVSQDMQAAAIKPFFAKHPLPHLKAWSDPENALGFHYATGQLPTTILYDRQGKEVARIIGAMDWSSREGQALLDATVNG